MYKRKLIEKTALLPLLVLLGALAGCPGSKPKPNLNLAVVPGADVLIQADLQALAQASLDLKDIGLRKKDTQPLVKANSRMLAAMGISEEDLLGALMTINLETISMSGNALPGLDNAGLVLAVKLAKPVTIERLQAGVQAALGANAKVNETPLLKRTAIFVNQPVPGAPDIYGGVSKDGLILFATVNKSAMEEVYRREDLNAPVIFPAGLAKVAGEISNSQAQAAICLSESMCQSLHESMEKHKDADNMAAIMAISAAQSITSVALGFSLTDNLEVRLCLGFNDEAASGKTFDLLQGSLLPMLRLMAAMDQQAMPFDPGNALTCTRKEGSEFINLALILTEAELRSCINKYGK